MARDLWKEDTIKLGGQSLVDKIIEMSDGIHTLIKAAEANDDRMMDAEIAIQKLYKAFPNGDVEGHARYHQLIIENTEETRRLRVAIQEKTISGLVWGAIAGLSLMVWYGFLHIIGTK